MPPARSTRGLVALTPALAPMAGAALLASAALAFCWKLVFGGLVVIGYDTMTYMYPYRAFAAEALGAGRVPLWNPHIYFGAPFLANLQSAVFYPLHVLFLILPAPLAMNWSVVLHLFLCAYFAFVAARVVLGVDFLSATVAGALYGLSGFVGAQVGHLNQLNAAAWLPLALTTCHLALIRRSSRWTAATAATLGVQLLAGHAQESYMSVATLGGYAAFWVVSHFRAGPRQLVERAGWAVTVLGLSGILAGGLTAVQLLPSSELTRYSIRAAGMTFGEAASFSLPPRELFVGMLPSFGLANPTSGEYFGWIGFSGLALVLFGVLFRVNRPIVLFFFILALISFMLALGHHFPVYEWAFRVPGVRLFRVPARWLMLTTLSTAMLAGVGLDFMRRLGAQGWRPAPESGDAPAGPWQRLIASTRLLLAFGVVAGLAAFLWPFQTPGPGIVPTHLIGVWLGAATGAAALSFWSLAMAPSRIPSALFAAAVFVELFLASRPLEYNNPNPPTVYTETRPVHEALLRATGPSERYVSVAATGYHPSDAKQLVTGYEPILGPNGVLATLINTKYKEILTPNLSMVFGVRSVDGYDGGVLPLRRYVDYKQLFVPVEQNVPDALLRDQLRQLPSAPRFRAMGATYVIADAISDITRDGVYYDLTGTLTLAPQQSITLRNVGLAHEARPHGPLSAIGIVTSLEGATAVTDGATVATLTLRSSSASGATNTAGTWQAVLVAGDNTAEGVYTPAVRHRQPAPFGSAATAGAASSSYLAQLPIGPAWAESVVIHNTLASGVLRVHGMTLIGEGSAQFPVTLGVDGELELLHRSDVKLYRDTRSLPRAHVVPRAILTEGLDTALAVLAAAGHDPRSVVVLERAPFVPPPSAGLRGQLRRLIDLSFGMLGMERAPVPGAIEEGRAAPTGAMPGPAAGTVLAAAPSVQWVEESPERLVLRVVAPQGGFLMLRDTYFPGWSVTIDGRPADLFRADVLFRGVPLPIGSTTQEVVFAFRSVPFERGAVLSMLSLVLTLGLALRPRLPWTL
ncbi:MAG: hypothetical protein ACR2NO_07260 [Chloroflexota bacterium]